MKCDYFSVLSLFLYVYNENKRKSNIMKKQTTTFLKYVKLRRISGVICNSSFSFDMDG
jgi:hypothetical protein